MNADATNTSKRTMDCGRVTREEILEKYLAGTLTDEDREAFEEHYFECGRCFDELRILQSIKTELRAGTAAGTVARPLGWWTWVAALAAVTLLAVAAALWMRTPSTSRVREQTAAVPPSPAAHRETPPRVVEASPPSPVSLESLARVEPPPYEPLTLRGTRDEAMTRFQKGMDRYRKADYRGAVVDLRAAAALEPTAPAIGFFLGICHLMLGQDAQAIAQLHATAALGDSAYLEDAHWYLAKAFLRRADLTTAEAELMEVVKIHGARTNEARALLADLARLRANPG